MPDCPTSRWTRACPLHPSTSRPIGITNVGTPRVSQDDSMTLERTDAPAGYNAWLAELKNRIREARLRASLAVNAELIGLYWRIGRDILERQERDEWGARVVDRLAVDLRAALHPWRNATAPARFAGASHTPTTSHTHQPVSPSASSASPWIPISIPSSPRTLTAGSPSKADPGQVCLYFDNQLIARHARRYGRHQ